MKKYLNITTKWDEYSNAYELILEDMNMNRHVIFSTLLKEFKNQVVLH